MQISDDIGFRRRSKIQYKYIQTVDTVRRVGVVGCGLLAVRLEKGKESIGDYRLAYANEESVNQVDQLQSRVSMRSCECPPY